MAGKVSSIYGLVAAAVAAAAPAGGQSVEYRSAAGVEYRAQRDTGAIARAESALAADPRSVERIIQLGVAQSGVRQYREAIQTFTRGLTVAPNDAMLYRWRGHRYLSVREFDRALDDLTRGSRLDSTNYGIWYHLGIVRYARGDFAAAAELAGATDWLWMALSRAGRAAEAQAMLDRHPDSLAATNAYAQRLRLYRGQIGPDDVITAADTGDVALATLSYGVGNWYLVRGDTGQARAWFERSVRSGGWPAFGFIMSEVELRRLSAQATGQRTREQIRASYDAHQGDFDYLLGDWEFSSVSREFGKGRGYWSAVRLAEGAQVLDEYRVVGDNGETYYVTNTLRAYNAVLDQWELVSTEGGTGLQNIGTGHRIGAEMHIEQKFGVTSPNPSIWRIRYYDIGPDRFSWTGDRSTDGGKTWTAKWLQIEARRVGPPRRLGPLAPAKK